uniref:Fatty acid desaturase domain-containing protein n=1 Tax=Mucochytrium quahogii TaxID=96639 RepID=A0A7S2WM42_9STRA|mmetsp:Transcript_1736/g.2613  ORF Transcript_1736/g.2613 Transcript_1736/m.2613 type:complete len:424 (-) Transcript_1736:486-1757(-)
MAATARKGAVRPGDEWIKELDVEAFGKEIRELGQKLRTGQGEADVYHLEKILNWNWMFTLIGICTMYWSPNLLTIVCLSSGLYSRWVMIGHHVCHGGYDDTEAASQGYSRWVFAVGSLLRRAIDWFDWMLPEAWNLEHGRLHHYSLNEDNDPDLVQRNVQYLRELDIPLVFKYAVVGFFAMTWKWTYYSSNTYNQLLLANRLKELNSLDEQMTELKREKEKLLEEKKQYAAMTVFNFVLYGSPSWWSTQRFLFQVMLPFFLYRFFVLPLPLLLFMGKTEFCNAVINLCIADVLTNMHSFLTVVPNHVGEDVYYFDSHVEANSDVFYLRQVIGSVDFSAGNDYIDFFHGFLNYQVEHHLWPSLTMRSYQKAHPLVKEICKKHGVPFIQENVFVRLRKTIDVMVGRKSMILFDDNLLTLNLHKNG